MPLSDEEKRAKKRAYNVAYYAAHATHARAKRAEYVAANRDAIIANDKARGREYYLANRERCLARSRARYAVTVKALRAAEPEIVSLRSRSRTYGLTPETMRSMFEAQGSCCAICKTEIPLTGRGAAHVDHDHDTGEVRGFLCGHCNRMLGLAKDSPNHLRSAAAYLDRRQPKLRLVR